MALQLSALSFAEKIVAKSDIIISSTLVETVTQDNIKIEIIAVEKIDGGVQVYAKAWNGKQQYGFGSDGSVEIERFRIFNPPILVPDPVGPVIQVYQDADGNNRQRTLREDPKTALLHTISQVVKSTGKLGTNIVPNRIGRTTSTFYPSAGAVSPVDGYVGKDDSSIWSTTRTGTADVTNVTSALFEHRNLIGNGNGPSAFTLFRVFLLFDTSPIPDGDPINSATLSVYGDAKPGTVGGNETLYAVSSTPASTSTLTTADYNSIGSTSFGDSGTTFNLGVYNDIALNSSGLANITNTGISQFALRGYYDFNNIAPVEAVSENSLNYWAADQTGTSQDPMLVVNHGASTLGAQSKMLMMGV